MTTPLDALDACPWGQCEHTANAHSRKNCLLCDCEKAPRVVLPDPPAMAVSTPPTADGDPQFDVEILHPCGICQGLTVDRDGHLDWHERQTATTERLVSTVDRLLNLVISNAHPRTPED